MLPGAIISPEFTDSYPVVYVPDQHVPEDQAAAPDPSAPYGVNPATGRPYTKSPEERAAFGQRMAEARELARQTGRTRKDAPTPPKRGGSRAPTPKAQDPADKYAAAAAGLIGIVATTLVIGAKLFRWQSLAMDSVTLSLRGGALAQALGDAAASEQNWLTTALERASKVTPWSSVAEEGLGIVAQVMVNHGMLAPSEDMGLLSPDGLMAEATAAADAAAPPAG
jgi:hypothetical protein